MDRDRRLTGWLRGQTDKVEAPVGFEVNNPWKVSVPFWLCLSGYVRGRGVGECMLTIGWGGIDGEEVFLSRGYVFAATTTRRNYVQMRQINQAFSSHLVPRMPSFSFSESSISK